MRLHSSREFPLLGFALWFQYLTQCNVGNNKDNLLAKPDLNLLLIAYPQEKHGYSVDQGESKVCANYFGKTTRYRSLHFPKIEHKTSCPVRGVPATTICVVICKANAVQSSRLYESPVADSKRTFANYLHTIHECSRYNDSVFRTRWLLVCRRRLLFRNHRPGCGSTWGDVTARALAKGSTRSWKLAIGEVCGIYAHDYPNLPVACEPQAAQNCLPSSAYYSQG